MVSFKQEGSSCRSVLGEVKIQQDVEKAMLDWYPVRQQTDAVPVVFLHTGGAVKKSQKIRKDTRGKSCL